MIFSLSLAITVLGTIYAIFQSWNKRSLLNPHLIYWIVTIYTIYLPALSYSGALKDDNYFNSIFLLGSAGAFLAMFIVPIRQPILKSTRVSNKNRLHPIILLLAITYCLFLVSTVFNLIISHGGILQALFYSRLDIYLGDGIKKGSTISTLLMLLPEVCYYILIASSLNTNKLIRAIILTAIIVIFYIFTANTRLPIIFPIAIITILYIHRFHLKSIRFIFPLALSLGILAVMVFSVVGSYLRNGQLENMDLSISQISSEIVNRQDNQLGYYDWINDLYKGLEQGKFEHEYGLGLIYYPVVSFIPRAFWSEKPNTSSSNRLTELVYDRKIGDGKPIHTFHLIGDGFFQLSWFGAFFYPLFFIYLLSLMQSLVARHIPNSEYWQVYILLTAVPFVRAELPVVKLLLTFLIVFLIYNIQRLNIKI